MSTPNKGDIIINPKTQRPIRVGGRIWLKLVKEGVVSGHYTDPKKLAPIGDNPEEQIEELNRILPPYQQAVRGRGRYTGQFTTRYKTPSSEEVSRHTAKTASRILSDPESLSELDGDYIESEIERLILQEMGVNKHPKKTGEQYVLEEVSDDSDNDYFGDDYE